MEITPAPRSSPAMSRGRVVGVLLVLAPVVVLVFLPAVLGLHRYVVADGAMDGGGDGSIPRGSVALTREVPAVDLVVGDVITFRPPVENDVEPGSSVTRRIVAIDEGLASTRGDGHDHDDPWLLDVSEDTYPRVVVAVPWVGLPFSGAVGQGGWVVLVSTVAVTLAVSAALPWRRLRERRHDARGALGAFP
jgi:signal peptidase